MKARPFCRVTLKSIFYSQKTKKALRAKIEKTKSKTKIGRQKIAFLSVAALVIFEEKKMNSIEPIQYGV